MPFVGVAGSACIVKKQVLRVISEAVGLIADLGGIEDVAAAVPLLRANRRVALSNGAALRGRFEQVAQRRHGAVVKVGRARPDAVERLIGIAGGLAEMAEPPRI